MATELHRNCPVCGANATQEHLRKSELRLVQCSACGMVYANPVPAELASGQYYNGPEAQYYVSPAKLAGDYAAVRFARELRLFRSFCPGGAVLDVGCSSGAFLHQLNQRFPGQYQILGTDASGPALDYAQAQGVPVVRGDFLRQDFGGRQFQALTFWAVLEHLADPAAFITRARELLAPSGLCFVLVPNLRSLACRVLGARYRYIYPQHLNYFARATLNQFVRENFEVVATRFTHFNPLVIWQDWRQGGREVSNRERGELLAKTTAYKQNAALTPLKVLYRLSERMLGLMGLADNIALVLRRK
jgi:2-polyprenyl-3-methyl-5-hydroxy-6-metoxy-1,4-benzoquinol methylase